ncbi:hypothetical protein HQ520_14535 [bacterium]|nr:hypothetical protein [bacterium]
MFEQLRAQTIRTVAEVKATLGDLAVSFQRSWSDNLTDAIMQTKGWRDVMRDIVKGLARQLVSTVANMVTSEVMLVAMGENAKSALYQSSGKNSIAIAVWEFAAKKAIKLKELLFERQVGERSLIMAWADSAKKVALKIWEFIAGMFASNAKFGWKGLVIAAVAGAAGTAAIMSARPSYLEGTDYVPETGMYRLHQGESVKTRTETTAAESGGSGNLTVYNLITHEAIARAMQSTAGKNTIVNIIDTDSLNNGRTRQMVRRG